MKNYVTGIVTSRRKAPITDCPNPDVISLTDEKNAFPEGFLWGKNIKYKPAQQQHEFGQLNCFLGHQQCQQKLLDQHPDTPMMFLVEDDCMAATSVWPTHIIDEAADYLNASTADVLTLHFRFPYQGYDAKWLNPQHPQWQAFRNANMQKHGKVGIRDVYIMKKLGEEHILCGTLAYLIKSKFARETFIPRVYDGLPVDIYMYNNINVLFMEVSPFIHDRRNGTLIG